MAFSSQFTGSPWLNAQQPQKASGLLGLLGVQSNPFTDFLSQHSNALVGLGAGLAGGGPDIGQAIGQGLQLGGQGKTADFARSEKTKADAQLAAQTNYTLQYLQSNRPDLAKAVQGGGLSLGDAWKMALTPDAASDPFTLSPGQVRYGADNKPLASVPAAPDQPPAGIQEYNLAVQQGYKGTIEQYKADLAKAGAPTSESAYSQQRGKDLAGNMQTIQNNGMQAYGTISQLNDLKTALDQSPQGFGAPTVQKLKKIGASLGIDTGNLGPADLAASISNQLALQLRNPANGAGMPGAMSDSDRQFLTSMVPGLGNTPQGNKLIIEASLRLEQRKVAIAQAANDYVKQNGQLDDGFYQQLQQWSNANPLFGDLASAAGGGGNIGAGPQAAPIDLGNGVTMQEIP